MPMIVAPARFEVAGGGVLPLDAVQGDVVAAYSYTRRLFSDFAGIPYRMRNAVSGATSDVVFTGDAVDLAQVASFSAGGQSVQAYTALYDQSGNANDATITGTPTICDVALGETNGWRCDGSNYFQVPSTLYSGKSAGAAFVLFYSGWSVGIMHVTADSGGSSFSPYGDGNAYENFLSTSRPSFASYPFTGTETRLHGLIQTGSALQVWKNGTQVGSNASATFSTTLNARQFPRGGQVRIFEVIFLGVQPSADDRALIEGDMLWGHGLHALLPSGHPYKSAAPT